MLRRVWSENKKIQTRKAYRFGNSRYLRLGIQKIRVPFADSITIAVAADVVNVKIPFMIGPDVLNSLQAMLDISKDMIMHPSAERKVPIVRTFKNLYLEWLKIVMFTTAELRKVHRNSFHTQPDRIFPFLSFPKARSCPEQIFVAIPHTECIFNRCVCLDLMKITTRTVLHAFERDAKFLAARFLSNESAT